MPVIYFNKSIKILLIFAIVLIYGCAQQPTVSDKDISESPPELSESGLFDFFTKKPKKRHADHQTIWTRLFDMYALPEIEDERIDREMEWYLDHPDYLTRIQERAEPYLYLIIEEIEANELPGEFALLPIVESAFRPYAYSHGRAAGLWQFIPSTGRYFGLEQNWWYDGRRDIYSSTQAAARYLKKLKNQFDGDPFLALASYNAGAGTIGRAIRQNEQKGKPTDYWSLELRKETMDYVPRLIAISKIFANAEKHDLPLRPIENKPVFESVDLGSQLDLAKAAEMSETSIDDLIELNPGFNRWCTAPEGPHRLLIPVDKVETFKQNLDALPEEERVTWKRHKIKSGENLSVIAKNYHTTVNVIRDVNQLDNNQIRAGHYLLIPSSSMIDKEHPYFKETHRHLASVSDNDLIYTVQKGDSLWGIANKYSVTTLKLCRWNRMGLKDPIRPGQELVIKSKKNIASLSASSKPLQPIKYTVKKGDSLFVISRKFNVSIDDLRKWNSVGKYLKPGQKLKLLVDITQPTT